MTIKTVDPRVSELRQAITAAKAGRRNRPVPSDLRSRALELVEAGRGCGTTLRETAAALGVHATTLTSWQRAAETNTAFVSARVVMGRDVDDEGPAGCPESRLRVAVIGGVDMATLGAVLRSLW
jgi:hypothetical protein